MCNINDAMSLSTCIHLTPPYLYSLTIEHVGPILSLAAATLNINMRDACMAKLTVNIDGTHLMPQIWENLSEEQLDCLLRNPEISTRGGEQGLRVVCTWIDGGKANNTLHERLDGFRHLLEFIDLASITEGALLDIISSKYAVTESGPHR